MSSFFRWSPERLSTDFSGHDFRSPNRCSFRVYSFPDKPMVASAEYQQGEILMDDSRKVQACLAVFSDVQAEVWSPGRSADFIRKVEEELDECTA